MEFCKSRRGSACPICQRRPRNVVVISDIQFCTVACAVQYVEWRRKCLAQDNERLGCIIADLRNNGVTI